MSAAWPIAVKLQDAGVPIGSFVTESRPFNQPPGDVLAAQLATLAGGRQATVILSNCRPYDTSW